MANYTPLLQQDGQSDESASRSQDALTSSLYRRWASSERSQKPSILLLSLLRLFQVALFLSSAAMLYTATSRWRRSNQTCLSTVSQWSPGLEAVEYESLTFRGSLYHRSPWKGEPRPELDALWHRVGQVGAMSVTADEVRRLGKDPDYVVKWPEELGGGHVASVEVFHHLHCLVSSS
jgi:hypothetical protein